MLLSEYALLQPTKNSIAARLHVHRRRCRGAAAADRKSGTVLNIGTNPRMCPHQVGAYRREVEPFPH